MVSPGLAQLQCKSCDRDGQRHKNLPAALRILASAAVVSRALMFLVFQKTVYNPGMSSEKATALVLRVVEFSETSVVVTLYTREFGKVRALAKGARRLKGPFDAALDLVCECRIVFLRKASEALDLLTEAKLERRFRGRGRDLSSLYAGHYVAELLGALTDDYDPCPELFDSAQQTLRALSGDEPVWAVMLRWELAMLRLLGHFPSLRCCVECGDELTAVGRVPFSQLEGGVLCAKCRPGKRHVASVSPEAIELLSAYAAPAADRTTQLHIPDRKTYGEVRGLLNHYLAHLLGHVPKTQRYLVGIGP